MHPGADKTTLAAQESASPDGQSIFSDETKRV
jgi:hypothetical protein